MADAYRESERKGVSSFKTGHEEEIEQLVVTINPAMGGIVSVEKINKGGKHEQLSEEECGRLVGEDEVEEIQAALDEAFEAAVVSVIGMGITQKENMRMTRRRPSGDFSSVTSSYLARSADASCIEFC